MVLESAVDIRGLLQFLSAFLSTCCRFHPTKERKRVGQIALPLVVFTRFLKARCTLNGKLSGIDRGRRVTVLNQNEAAIVFRLELAVQ
jgi:putative component of membrane protein insertase Oxa1/YidC/SpoIIIJ protein YidD